MTDLLRTAYGLHQAGRLVEAIAGYREVLRRNPRQFDTLYLLGSALLQRGQAAEAERILPPLRSSNRTASNRMPNAATL